MAVRPLFIANWKMNKALADVHLFVKDFLAAVTIEEGFAVAVAPPATHLTAMVAACNGTSIAIAGQNAGPALSGAFTGEVSPQVLKEAGVEWVLIGHSERRHVFNEDEALIGRRLAAACEAGLRPVLCVGETLGDRKSGRTQGVIERQLAVLKSVAAVNRDLVVAYEPVWAIGTGENATPQQASEAHTWIAEWAMKELKCVLRILYGGSVKADNAAVLMEQPQVSGLLVGGASLEAGSFAAIIRNGIQGWEKKALRKAGH